MKGHDLARAATQGAACGLVFGIVLLIDRHLWQPDAVAERVRSPAVADVVRARRLEVVDPTGTVRGMLVGSPQVDEFIGLALADGTGRPRITLRVAGDGRPNRTTAQT